MCCRKQKVQQSSALLLLQPLIHITPLSVPGKEILEGLEERKWNCKKKAFALFPQFLSLFLSSCERNKGGYVREKQCLKLYQTDTITSPNFGVFFFFFLPFILCSHISAKKKKKKTKKQRTPTFLLISLFWVSYLYYPFLHVYQLQKSKMDEKVLSTYIPSLNFCPQKMHAIMYWLQVLYTRHAGEIALKLERKKMEE